MWVKLAECSKPGLSDNRGYIRNQAVGISTEDHFNLPGHSLADLNITILERVKIYDENYRKERETYFINQFNTFYKGINSIKTWGQGRL